MVDYRSGRRKIQLNPYAAVIADATNLRNSNISSPNSECTMRVEPPCFTTP